MLTPSVMIEALVLSCRLVLPSGMTLLKSGDPADSSLSAVWLEFWVDRFGSPLARRNAPYLAELSITVNCFGRNPSTPDQLQILAESTRQHLTRLRLPVSQEAFPVGFITFYEAEMRDLSRPATQKSAALRQWSVTVRGTFQTLQSSTT